VTGALRGAQVQWGRVHFLKTITRRIPFDQKKRLREGTMNRNFCFPPAGAPPGTPPAVSPVTSISGAQVAQPTIVPALIKNLVSCLRPGLDRHENFHVCSEHVHAYKYQLFGIVQCLQS
jgi:hypothetical protein